MRPTTLEQIIKYRSICLCGQPTVLDSGIYTSGNADRTQVIKQFNCDTSKLPIEVKSNNSPAIIANFNFTIDLLRDKFKITDVVYKHYKSAKVGPANEFIKRYINLLTIQMKLVCSNKVNCKHDICLVFDVSFQLKKNYNSSEGSLINVGIVTEKFNVYSLNTDFNVWFWPKTNNLRIWPKSLKTQNASEAISLDFTPEQFDKILYTQNALLNKIKLWTLLT